MVLQVVHGIKGFNMIKYTLKNLSQSKFYIMCIHKLTRYKIDTKSRINFYQLNITLDLNSVPHLVSSSHGVH